MKKMVGVLGLILMLIPLVAMNPLPAAAHPLGNFSINVSLGIEFRETTVAASLIVDMGEIPTFQEKALIDSSGDEAISPIEGSNYAIEACSRHQEDLHASLDGSTVDVESDGAKVDFIEGTSGLEIMRLGCGYQMAIPQRASGQLSIANEVYLDRVGWREMTAAATGFALDTDLPVASPSDLLTVFPPGPLADRSTATIGYTREAGAVLVAPASTLVERIGSNLQVGWLALFTAGGLGIAHALAPGHGKTLMAAYLVGRRGKIRHAAGLGLAVAVSHTLGVAILGMITVLTTSRFEPEKIYPWLSIASAALVTAIGGAMLIRALVNRSRDHRHEHGHDHGPGEHAHGHDHADHGHHYHPNEGRPLGWRSLAALGLAGGLVPSASAVVLLLSAVSKGDPWFGIGLVAAFGIGMAVALVAAGIAAMGAVHLGWRFIQRDHLRHRLERVVPALAGASVTVVGLVLLLQAAKAWS